MCLAIAPNVGSRCELGRYGETRAGHSPESIHGFLEEALAVRDLTLHAMFTNQSGQSMISRHPAMQLHCMVAASRNNDE